jgi:hypothetical protein
MLHLLSFCCHLFQKYQLLLIHVVVILCLSVFKIILLLYIVTFIGMKKLLLFVSFFIITVRVLFALTVDNTYTIADIPTNSTTYSATCNGPVTPLTVSLPAGGPWVVSSIDVVYDMTAQGGGYMSEQRSKIYCQNTASAEGVYYAGTGVGGVQAYNRTGLTIANGVYAGSTNLVFEMQAYRTWGPTTGCNTIYQIINNNSWKVTVTYAAATPMTFTSSTCTQTNTSDVLIGSTDQEIIGIEVVTAGTTSPLDVTQFRLKTDVNTTDWANDISGNVKIYYTGTSSTFATTTLYGSVAPAAGNINIFVNGTQTLSSGTNYFWVAYDIAPGATAGNVVDSRCNRVTMSGGVGNQVPTTTVPAGTRTIVPITCGTTTNSFPYQEGFEGGATGLWSNMTTDDFDWTNFTGATGSGGTGPTTAYELNRYLYIETSGGLAGDEAWLDSECFDLTGLANPKIDFAHHMYGTTIGTLELLISTNGVTWASLWSLSGDQGDVWNTASVDISAYAGQTVKLRFKGIHAGTFTGDIAIDDINIYNALPMVYTSSTCTQTNTSNAEVCASDQEIIGVEVVMTGLISPLDITQFRVRTDGSTAPLTDIANIEVFYTGTSSIFSNANSFGSAVPLAAGNDIFINGTQTLVEGTNYFWIAYDLDPGSNSCRWFKSNTYNISSCWC